MSHKAVLLRLEQPSRIVNLLVIFLKLNNNK